jgi:hypothetical protein
VHLWFRRRSTRGKETCDKEIIKEEGAEEEISPYLLISLYIFLIF